MRKVCVVFYLGIMLTAPSYGQSQEVELRIEGFQTGAIGDLSEQLKLSRKKQPSAYVSGYLFLRDATYRYNERILEVGSPLLFASGLCDIYQVVLSVSEGSITLVTTEASSEAGIEAGTSIYPDKLTAGSGMFSYTLYSSKWYKSFLIKNGDYNGDNDPAKVTAFSYCFSTDPAAMDLFYDTHDVKW